MKPDPSLPPTQVTSATAGGRRATTAEVESTQSEAANTDPPNYDLLGEIGRGGMGIVYRARDRRLRRDVAIKLLHDRFPTGSVAAARFVEEAQITAQLQHPGIPPVHEVGTLPDGRPFLAMKLIQGETFDQLLKTNAACNRLAVFEAACHALAYAHAHGVIHRDLKPHNIMVGAFGEVQVMDWGLAKVLTSENDASPVPAADFTSEISSDRDPSDVTKSGSVIGTLAYLPPEQAAGDPAQIGPRADVFGLGGILCNILTGQPPYTGHDVFELKLKALAADLTATYEAIQTCGADADLIALCLQCLAISPDDRPADAGEVATAIAAWWVAADDRVRRAELARTAAEAREAERRRRQRVVAIASGLVVTVLLVGTGISAWQAWRATLAESRAEHDRDSAVKAEAIAIARQNDALAAKDFLDDILRQGSARGQATRDRQAVPYLTLKAALDYASRRISGAFAEQPEIEADLRTTIGQAYLGLADFDQAKDHLTKARDLRLKTLGPDHPSTLMSLNNLAKYHQEIGEYAIAEPLLRQAIAGLEKSVGPTHKDSITAVNNLAVGLYYRGDIRGAIDILKPQLAKSETDLGPDQAETLSIVGNLGTMYQALGDYAAAARELDRTLVGREKTLGPKHPDTLISVTNLALLRLETGDLAGAEGLLQRALAGCQSAFGPDHPETLNCQNNLAGLYDLRKDYRAAKPLFQLVFQEREKLFGTTHLTTLIAAMNLAGVHVELKEFAAAEALYLTTLDRYETTVGPDHRMTLKCVNNIAGMYLRSGNLVTAERFFRRALLGREKTLGPSHPLTLNTAGNLAGVLDGLEQFAAAEALYHRVAVAIEADRFQMPNAVGRVVQFIDFLEQRKNYAAAEEWERKVLAKVRSQSGSDSDAVAVELTALGSYLLNQQKWTEAETTLRENLAIREKRAADPTLRVATWQIANAKSMLGEALAHQMQFAEAEPLLIAGYEGISAAAKVMPPKLRYTHLREAIERLIFFYSATGDGEKVVAWQQQMPTEPAPRPRPGR